MYACRAGLRRRARIDVRVIMLAPLARSLTDSFERCTLIRSGELQSLRIDTPLGGVAYLAHPRHPAQARREGVDGRWEIECDPKPDSGRMYRRMLARIDDSCFDHRDMGAILRHFPDFLMDLGYPPSLLVAGLEHLNEYRRRVVRLCLKYVPANEPAKRRSFTFILSAGDSAVRSYEYDEVGGVSMRGVAEYDNHDGIPSLRSFESSITAPGGIHSARRLAISLASTCPPLTFRSASARKRRIAATARGE